MAKLLLLGSLALPVRQTYAQTGKALELDGQGDWLDIPASALHTLFEKRPLATTLEVWFRFERGGTESPRIFHSENAFQLFISSRADSTTLIANIAFETDRERIVTDIQSFRWYHAALELDDHVMQFYLDGRKVGGSVILSGAVSPDIPVHGLRLGANSFNQSDNFKGKIDDMRLWNRVLSQEEIQAGMNRSLTGSEEGLAGYWTFENVDAHGLVPDLSGRGNHGMLVGDAHLAGLPAQLRLDLNPSEGNQGLVEKSIRPGDRVALQLFGTSFPEITGYGFQVAFDDTALSYMDGSFTSGTFLPDGQQLVFSRDGRVEAGVASFPGAVGSGDGFLGQLDFTVQEALFDCTELTVTALGFTLKDGSLKEEAVRVSVRLCNRLRGDFDGDGWVGFRDFLLFAVGFRENDPRFDLTDDGVVGFADFLIFVQMFGSTRDGPSDEPSGSPTYTVSVHGRYNCVFLDSSASARTTIGGGTYSVTTSGNAYYQSGIGHGNVLIRYPGADSTDHSKALQIGDTYELRLRTGYGVYAFFAEDSLLSDNNGTVNLSFDGTQLPVDGRYNCIALAPSVAARISIPAGTYTVKAIGKAYFGIGGEFDGVLVQYAGSDRNHLDILTTGSSSILHIGAGQRFYAFFADWSYLGDNSGSMTLEFYRR